MATGRDVYERYDVPTVINAVGHQTRVGGSLIRPEALAAMEDAAGSYVDVAELQARASELIAEVTGADAGYVTSGAASGIALAAAACLARDDFGRMTALPRIDEGPDEILIPAAHQIEYTFAFRLAGATLRPVGEIDNHTGKEQLKPWQLADAISDRTAAVAYVDRPRNQLSLARIADVADEYDVPVIVDAAAELPPKANLTRYLEAGASAVVFSGGKAIRGPQSTGFVAGEQWLIRSIALQHLPVDTPDAFWEPPSELITRRSLPAGTPNYGIGRAMKVGKEEIVGLMRALELFLEESEAELYESWVARTREFADRLGRIDGLSVEVAGVDVGDGRSVPHVEVGVDDGSVGDVVRRLRDDQPRVIVGEQHVEDGYLTLDPRCVLDEQVPVLVEAVRRAV